jgi:tRNA A37 threonylcarbamoyladenosine dehydratase
MRQVFTGVKSFDFEQSTPSNKWIIVHGLGIAAPVVDVLVNTGSGVAKILPLDVVVVDNTTVEIHFTSPQTGKARLV